MENENFFVWVLSFWEKLIDFVNHIRNFLSSVQWRKPLADPNNKKEKLISSIAERKEESWGKVFIYTIMNALNACNNGKQICFHFKASLKSCLTNNRLFPLGLNHSSRNFLPNSLDLNLLMMFVNIIDEHLKRNGNPGLQAEWNLLVEWRSL